MVVYCTLNYVFPAAGAQRHFEEIDVAEEEELEKEPYVDAKSSLEKDRAVSVRESVAESSV